MLRILIVEDIDATAKTLERRLKRQDNTLEIFHVKTLAEGLAKSVELKADITLLDLCLPDVKDWRETAQAIEKFHPPVLVITDMDLPLVEAECHKYGVQQVFPKRVALELIPTLLSAMIAAKMRTVAAEQRQANGA